METKTVCRVVFNDGTKMEFKEHKWEYHTTEEGNQYSCCFQCGEVEWQAEDHHGG